MDLKKLSIAEQIKLVEEARKGSEAAKEKLVMSCMGMVRSVAWWFASRQQSILDFDDFVCIGVETILNALSASAYDTTRKVKFSTYVLPRIFEKMNCELKANSKVYTVPMYENRVGISDFDGDLSKKLLCEQIIRGLSAFEHYVICSYFGLGLKQKSLSEIGMEKGYTTSYVCQVKNNVLKKLRISALKYGLEKNECLGV